jgi:putative peptidoglycan lipid II flippase
MTPGFTGESLELTVTLTKIMLLSPLLLGMSAVVGSVLQVHKSFFIYSIAPILYNVGIIIGALFFVPTFGISGLAWGVVLGAVLHLVIQLPTYWMLGYRWKPVFNPWDKNVKAIITLTIPRTISLAISQLNLLVITVIASTLAAGSITVFNLANNIQSFPLGLFGISYALAVFPTLSALADRKREFIDTLSSTMRSILFFIIPSSVLLIILRAQVVRIILGSGRFDWEDTILTLQTLSVFAISLLPQAMILVLVRAFYARRDTVTPLVIGLLSALGNIVMALALAPQLGVVGLALAFTTGSMLNFVLLYLALHLKLGRLDGEKIAFSGAKILIASFMMAIVAQAAKYPLERVSGTDTFLGLLSQATVAGVAGMGTYILVCWLLKSDELSVVFQSIQRRLKPPTIPEDIREIS